MGPPFVFDFEKRWGYLISKTSLKTRRDCLIFGCGDEALAHSSSRSFTARREYPRTGLPPIRRDCLAFSERKARCAGDWGEVSCGVERAAAKCA
jgi:hypothetical protein